MIKSVSGKRQPSKKSAKGTKAAKNTGRPSLKSKRKLLTEKQAEELAVEVRQSQRIQQRKEMQMDQRGDSGSEESSVSSDDDE